MNKPLKVGFDLDGVLLYNPARIVRRPVAYVKEMFLPKRRQTFIIPKNWLTKIVWEILHLSSLFVSGGFTDVEKLVREKKIEAYIVTARYHFLQNNTKRWLAKLDKQGSFTKMCMNMRDEQPHLFKERMIKELELDVFIEDNFDIVSHLRSTTTAKIFWIYNIMDRKLVYPYKFSSLKQATEKLKSLV